MSLKHGNFANWGWIVLCWTLYVLDTVLSIQSPGSCFDLLTQSFLWDSPGSLDPPLFVKSGSSWLILWRKSGKPPHSPEVLPQCCARAVRRRRQRSPFVPYAAYWRCRTPSGFVGYYEQAVLGRGQANTSPSVTQSWCGSTVGTTTAHTLEKSGVSLPHHPIVQP